MDEVTIEAIAAIIMADIAGIFTEDTMAGRWAGLLVAQDFTVRAGVLAGALPLPRCTPQGAGDGARVGVALHAVAAALCLSVGKL